MTDKERHDTKLATIFELELILKNGDKKEYTVDELIELLDKIAMSKD